ncbi:MAG: hypothetical protein ABMB14_15235, partial [Myxococcota bacterium]
PGPSPAPPRRRLRTPDPADLPARTPPPPAYTSLPPPAPSRTPGRSGRRRAGPTAVPPSDRIPEEDPTLPFFDQQNVGTYALDPDD